MNRFLRILKVFCLNKLKEIWTFTYHAIAIILLIAVAGSVIVGILYGVGCIAVLIYPDVFHATTGEYITTQSSIDNIIGVGFAMTWVLVMIGAVFVYGYKGISWFISWIYDNIQLAIRTVDCEDMSRNKDDN